MSDSSQSQCLAYDGTPIIGSDFRDQYFKALYNAVTGGELVLTTAYTGDLRGPSTASHDPSPINTAAIEKSAREAGAQAERERIMGKLEALKPMEQPYTRRDWALEQRGEQRLYERIIKAICGPVTRESAGKD
jgi:hypothetical protein